MASPMGQHSLTPLAPSMTNSIKNGTTRLSTAVMKPVIGAMVRTSVPETSAATTTGSPTAPKATGTVFAMSATMAARMGEKPTAMSIAAAIATGAP